MGPMSDQRRIKIEIPVPQFRLSRLARFSLRSMLIAVALVALVLGVDQRARQIERAQHHDSYYFVVVSTPQGMSTMQMRGGEFPDLHALAASTKPWSGLKNDGIDPGVDWPPRVWITRTDWPSPTREERIEVACSGTFDKPQFSDNPRLRIGDRLFFDFVAGGHK